MRLSKFVDGDDDDDEIGTSRKKLCQRVAVEALP
jgi:hypothetical protein